MGSSDILATSPTFNNHGGPKSAISECRKYDK